MYDEDDTGGHYESNRPPQDMDAERAVLGSLMASKDALTTTMGTLRGEDFWQPAHETIYNAIVDMFAAGEAVDTLTVKNHLEEAGLLGKIGGAPYLHTLSEAALIPANVDYYADIVRGKAMLRRLADAGGRITQLAMRGEGDPFEIANEAQARLYAATPGLASEDYVRASEVIAEALDEIEVVGARGDGVHGVPTGFIDLDELTGGLQGGQMVIIAARPALGKSTLALDFCRSAAVKHNMAACMFSLEMGRREIIHRMLSAEGRIPLANIRNGRMSDDDWNRVAGVLPRIEAAPLFIDDTPNMTMVEIRAKARRLKREHDLRLIVVDYLQLMTSGRQVENRQVEVSEFSRQIKLLAKELDVPIVALSQLNRGPEQRTSKRPMMSDLRESGSLEQDADIVMLLHRDDAYEVESARPGEADVIVAKHRNGPTRDVTLAFQGHYSRFASMASD